MTRNNEKALFLDIFMNIFLKIDFLASNKSKWADFLYITVFNHGEAEFHKSETIRIFGIFIKRGPF